MWVVKAQVGNIESYNRTTIITLYQNKYTQVSSDGGSKKYEKTRTVKLPIICNFIPRGIKVGDNVIAEGVFEPSFNDSFTFAMKCNHIACINSEDQQDK